MLSRPSFADPLLIGGTGRCGTHAVSSLVGKHPRYARIATECRFHCDPGGVPDLLDGKVGLDEFLHNLRGKWWRGLKSDGKPTGLFKRISYEVLDDAATAFERDFGNDPYGAATRLIHALFDPIASATGKPSWVEMSKYNVNAAPTLLKLLPAMKAIHVMRDGRDIASSVTKQSWGAESLPEALEWWERRIAGAERGLATLPPDRIFVLRIEDLAFNDRESSYTALADFLGVPRGLRGRRGMESMRRYFAEKISRDNANIGRWREGLAEDAQESIMAAYIAGLERLITAGTPGRPMFERYLVSAREESGIAASFAASSA